MLYKMLDLPCFCSMKCNFLYTYFHNVCTSYGAKLHIEKGANQGQS